VFRFFFVRLAPRLLHSYVAIQRASRDGGTDRRFMNWYWLHT
jgi:hypothetical protein